MCCLTIPLRSHGEENSPFLCNPVWRDRQQMSTAKNISFSSVGWGAEKEGLGEDGSHSQMLWILLIGALQGMQEIRTESDSSGHTESIPWCVQSRFLKCPLLLLPRSPGQPQGAVPGLSDGHCRCPGFSSFSLLSAGTPDLRRAALGP